MKLLKVVDDNVGISDYANQCFDVIKQQLVDYLPQLLTNTAVTTFANSVITSALTSPEVMKNFISSITPELSRQVIEQSLPTITDALASELTPQLVEGVSTNMVAQLMPELINGVTQTMITDVAPQLAPQIATQVASELAITSAQNSLFNAASATLSKVAVSYALNGISGYLGIDSSVVQPVTWLLTNSGGKTIKLKKLKKTKRYRRYKKTKTYKK